MAKFVKGDIVVVPFPFSNLSDKNIILYKVGSIKENKTKEVVQKIIEIVKN